MVLQVGSIVTVTLDCSFQGKQGEVVRIVHDGDENGPIGVAFGKELAWLFKPSCEDSERTTRFQFSELQEDKDWNLQTRVRRLFGRHWHSLCTSKEPFVSGQQCSHEECDALTVARIMVNIWGTVVEYDVCGEHRDKWHGKCVDEFPERKPAAA